ncbi:hypothetical protein ACWT_7379 [Actinoplanes sp. SE50]|uniref:hypothetical protein n=1 Tax=unclassified Actinoplanes TaxID=2626549 RepID=UPI00023EE023|nr:MULTISPECIES: hypothetical protein [unclassified Actinoplanes]AEV88389.1 hypothetical protein ACPL_7509 [Actinoplanes sp. SE50/110]ATO86794.1 hypothetical protein ACWT_7379 [Actinoplanes sp. SE50]SLM04212.1 hypothetical protein ACSP50_7515 [Actinoplanes sp. SE50/110]
MTGLWDAERDAGEVMRALHGLAALLGRDPDEDTLRLMRQLAENGVSSAARVRDYLHEQRGPGDGDAAVVASVLAPWREWTPSRGHLFGAHRGSGPVGARRINEVPQPRRCDPGE